MANTWIKEIENDIEEFQITHEDITEGTPLCNKLHNFKGFQEKQEPFGQGKNERDMEGKLKGRNKAVEINIDHSHL